MCFSLSVTVTRFLRSSRGLFASAIYGLGRLWFKKLTLHLEDRYSNREASCILYGGSQCAPSYETRVIKFIDGSNEITDVNGGIVCGQCRGDWKIVVVVNNADPIPDAEGFQGKNFSSYNAASVNMGAFVVQGS